MVVYLISTIVLANLGFEHNLYQYGSGPSVPLSDMNGQGQFWIGAYWFRLYWARLRADPAGAGLWPVAARDGDAGSCRACGGCRGG